MLAKYINSLSQCEALSSLSPLSLSLPLYVVRPVVLSIGKVSERSVRVFFISWQDGNENAGECGGNPFQKMILIKIHVNVA